jgi:hypothetical protein
LFSKGLDCLDSNEDTKVDTWNRPNQSWDSSFNRCNWRDLAAKRCFAKKLYRVSCSTTQECQTNFFLNCIGGFCSRSWPQHDWQYIHTGISLSSFVRSIKFFDLTIPFCFESIQRLLYWLQR